MLASDLWNKGERKSSFRRSFSRRHLFLWILHFSADDRHRWRPWWYSCVREGAEHHQWQEDHRRQHAQSSGASAFANRALSPSLLGHVVRVVLPDWRQLSLLDHRQTRHLAYGRRSLRIRKRPLLHAAVEQQLSMGCTVKCIYWAAYSPAAIVEISQKT